MPARPRRILLHAGFHKTGTSTLQETLRENGDLLAPLWRVETLLYNPLMRQATQAARQFSLSRKTADLGLFQAACVVWFDAMAAELTADQGLLISSEDFAGHMPGVGSLRDYCALGPVLAAFVQIALQFFGPATQFEFLLTTRAPGPWMQSLHWQQAKGARLQDSFAAFSQRLPAAADHAAMAQSARLAVAPWPVTMTALEDVAHRRLGPAEALLDLAHLPAALAASLLPVAPRNARPEANLSDLFVALNRMGLPDDQLKARKDALRKAAVPSGPKTG